MEAIKAFRVYLYGRFFILITDHNPLCYLFNLKDYGSRLIRQRMELLDYNFKILHRSGAQNHVIENREKSCDTTVNKKVTMEISSLGEVYLIMFLLIPWAQYLKVITDINTFSRQFATATTSSISTVAFIVRMLVCQCTVALPSKQNRYEMPESTNFIKSK